MLNTIEPSFAIVAYFASDDPDAQQGITVLTDSGMVGSCSASDVHNSGFVSLKYEFGTSVLIDPDAILSVNPAPDDRNKSIIIIAGFHRLEVAERQSKVFSRLTCEKV